MKGKAKVKMKPQFVRKLALALSALASIATAEALGAEVILPHVHGLAFTADGKSLVAPAHVGLAVYRDGRWSTAPGPAHDLMGFSMAGNAIYTSGHPAPGSPLRNPLGLMKSTDAGATWQQLGLSAESDFHLMAAGYRSNAVYAVNHQPNSRMPQPGIHFTQDDGKSWKRSAATGLSERLIGIAAHPVEAGTIAAATEDGLYLSRDFGSAFKRVGPQTVVTAVLFDLDGKRLYFVPADDSALHRIALDGKSDTKLALPKLERDFVLYIAQSPAKPDQLAIATRQRHVFLSSDGGRSWKRIAREGQAP